MEALGLNLGFFLVQLFNFILAALILSAAWKPLTEALEKRKATIAKGLEDARVAEDARANAEKEAANIIAEAQAERAKIVAEANAQADKVRVDLKAAAEAEAADIKSAAEAGIEEARNNVLNDVRPHISALAMAAANKVVGESLDKKKQQALIDDFFAGVEGGKVAVLDGADIAGDAAEVVSALPLAAKEQTKIAKELGIAADAVAFKVDPNLLGGLVVRVGDREIDGSVKRKMDTLSGSLG